MSIEHNNNNNTGRAINPFHQGESSFQTRVGVSKEVSTMGKRAISFFMPLQHQTFFSKLPMIFVGAEDQNNNIWSSVLFGDPGFIQIDDLYHFTINDSFIDIDPLAGNINVDNEIGFLGIQFETRRRNRVSAKILEVSDSSLKLKVKQCFGNCPKYIQKRQGKMFVPADAPRSVSFTSFDEATSQYIQSCDSLFIASQHLDENSEQSAQGIDVSHRGGMPGFVQLADKHTLLIPDYMGNNFFNTLGNISLNPKVGIQFLDYKNGHRLMLTGTAEVIWAEDQELPFAGVDRMTRFSLKQGYLLKNSFPFEWEFESYSPFSEAYMPDSSIL